MNGGTPPEMPSGENGKPPEKPDGENEQPPEKRRAIQHPQSALRLGAETVGEIIPHFDRNVVYLAVQVPDIPGKTASVPSKVAGNRQDEQNLQDAPRKVQQKSPT